ncbi:MAG: nitrate reductase associated protein [Synechococcaceae cyanobacterium]|nr:nitrate reductase associated protein [Synechococcaceae cyanobacterium]
MFAFEADFGLDLRCIPMAVRRKLDLAGVKLKLVHWHGLEAGERRRLLAWSDDAAAILGLRDWLLERSAGLPQGPAGTLPPQPEDWPEACAPPPDLLQTCTDLGLDLPAGAWSQLDVLQRFALVKLGRSGHEHRNLAAALTEFGLRAEGRAAPADDC